MQTITISFILPVYNVEPYLRTCLDSILSQSMTDYEILMVNDGSTDGSLALCREYEAKYDFIHVLDQPKSGVSAARNRGLFAAKGKYICFLDADDFYIDDFAKEFYMLCESQHLDIIRGNYCVVEGNALQNTTKGSFKELSYYGEVLQGDEFLCYSLNEHAHEVVPWLGFFRRDFICEHQISFPVGISFEEDHIFFLQALIGHPCRIMQVPSVFYAYRQRKGSATSRLSLRKAQDVAYVVGRELSIAERIPQLSVRRATQRFAGSSFFQITNIYGRVDHKDRAAVRRMCSFRTKLICSFRAANTHQRIKNAAFTFAPHLLGLAYDMRKTNA